MTGQPSTAPPPPYLEKNPSEMSSAQEPRDTQSVTRHMFIQQLAGDDCLYARSLVIKIVT